MQHAIHAEPNPCTDKRGSSWLPVSIALLGNEDGTEPPHHDKVAASEEGLS